MHDVKVSFRKILLSSGEFTTEVVIFDESVTVFESSPEGLTIGLKEEKKTNGSLPKGFSFKYKSSLSQLEFDYQFTQKYKRDISTALSLAYLRYRSTIEKTSSLSAYLSKEFGIQKSSPLLIFNILNGGKHAGNNLSFCEFMIIPKKRDFVSSIQVASEVYNDLRELILKSYSKKDVLVGREGGFAPDIDKTTTALDLIINAINKRHEGEVEVAIDIAANNFSIQKNRSFVYRVDGGQLNSDELLSYYRKTLSMYPEITYIEDCFHENDLRGWSMMIKEFGNQINIAADDLTVSNTKYAKKHINLYNACVLKVNQIGTVSGFVETLMFCNQNNIKTIISQRSGETDSDILSHLAVGLGADYMKAGAPARERIIKYNTLIRL